MPIFNKNIIHYCLLLLIILGGFQCRHLEKKKLPNQNSDYKFEGNLFKAGDSLYSEKLVCFFTESTCPSCILEVKNYSESIINCPKVLFFTNTVELTNRDFFSIINPKVFNFNNCWTSIKNPIIFQTNKKGRIYNLLEIKYSEPYSLKEYLLKLSANNECNELTN